MATLPSLSLNQKKKKKNQKDFGLIHDKPESCKAPLKLTNSLCSTFKKFCNQSKATSKMCRTSLKTKKKKVTQEVTTCTLAQTQRKSQEMHFPPKLIYYFIKVLPQCSRKTRNASV